MKAAIFRQLIILGDLVCKLPCAKNCFSPYTCVPPACGLLRAGLPAVALQWEWEGGNVAAGLLVIPLSSLALSVCFNKCKD